MLESFSFILIWLLLPVFWHYLLRVAGLNLFRVTIPSVVIISFYLFQYIGLPILYFRLIAYRALFVTDKWLMVQVFLYTSLTITLMIVGFIAARYCFGPLNWNWGSRIKLREQFTQTHHRTGCYQQGNLQLNLGLIPLVLISVAVLVIYLSKVGLENIALFSTLGISGSELSTEVARSKMTNSFEGKYHWYKPFMNELLTFSLFVIFAQFLVKKKTSLSAMLTAVILTIIFLIATVVMVIGTQKAPMASLLIALFLVYVVVKKGGRISPINLMPFFSLLLFLLCIFYIYFMQSNSVSSALSSIVSRTITGQIGPAYHYIEYFQTHEFLLGRSLPNPRGIFRSDQFYLTVEMMNWVHPEQAGKGVFGSMPTVYWGEMYANFGFLGVFIPPPFVGFGLYWINSIVFRFRYSPLTTGFFVWLLMHYKTLSQTGLGEYMLDLPLVVICLTFAFLYICTGQGRASMRNCFGTKGI